MRHRLLLSKLFRSVEFTHTERKRLIEKIRQTVEETRPLEREINRLEKRIEASRNNGNKDLRKELRDVRSQLTEIEDRTECPAIELKRTYQNIVSGEQEAEAAKRELIEANLRLVL